MESSAGGKLRPAVDRGGVLAAGRGALSEQFLTHQKALDQVRIVALAGLIENSKRSLRSTASISESLQGMEQAIGSQNPDSLRAVFRLHWSELVIETGLVQARFYSKEGRLLADFGEPDGSPRVQEYVERWVQETNASEMPVLSLLCGDACRYYAATPLMVEGKRFGVALLASSVGDIVSAFYQVTGADIALLLPHPASLEGNTGRWIAPWRMSVPAMTGAQELYPLLVATAQAFSLETLESGVVIRNADQRTRIIAVPLDDPIKQAGGYWLVIANVSAALANIRAEIRRNWLYGVSGLVLGSSILVFLLWKPLTRLRATAETLPLLGQGEFRKARESIAEWRAKHWVLLPDESDLLDNTTVSLSHRLEGLEAAVSIRAAELREQADRLRQERDFVRRLLDTAQAIILTQNEEGEIFDLNKFGEDLRAKIAGEAAASRDFYATFVGSEAVGDVRDALHEMLSGRLGSYQHNSEVRRPDSGRCSIAWRHSPLELAGDCVAVLSVGLDVTEQRKAERRIAWLADHDPLTNSFNRRRFQEEVTRALDESARFGHGGCLVYLDLDQFKYINDAAGHAVGDSLLKMVALTLASLVRSTDVVGRLSGDEFAALLPHTDEAGGTTLAEKLMNALRAIEINVGGRPHRVTASIGVALFPQHAVDVQDLLAVADVAMYQAKAAGRNCWQLYLPEAHGREFIRSVLSTKAMIEEALSQNRLLFHYQPIVDLRSGAIAHIEALIRLQLPDGRLVMPADFIGVAERVGVIRRIDSYVLNLAAAEIECFVAAGVDMAVAINQSAFAIEEAGFVGAVERLVEEHPATVGRMILEITESAAVTNLASTHDVMRELQALGCQVAIDDFGTGFSSLSYLKQLPVDYIKIDGVFVRDVVDEPENQVLLRAVVELARLFGKQTVAEQVERSDVYDWLSRNGVDLAQGFLVARGMPRAELVSFLRGRLTQGIDFAQ